MIKHGLGVKVAVEKGVSPSTVTRHKGDRDYVHTAFNLDYKSKVESNLNSLNKNDILDASGNAGNTSNG